MRFLTTIPTSEYSQAESWVSFVGALVVVQLVPCVNIPVFTAVGKASLVILILQEGRFLVFPLEPGEAWPSLIRA